ncbi:acyl-CoA dehydrogenase family protein [Yoonia vestfoldensis]|jgi:hypothetical protein|uniref:Acyl-CoA dehydrogenase n=1 Tax=Yoonia vestfoldensis TaxID=245188 RepID=A0A1Y0EDQ8_9RHOB|nr:acyl-CoA dehydrogenase family protein [Yoonia vestfoldensis]ARU01598.1 acyl-CoA dehydrogenase [Yoonia vestfoldensis]
MDFSQTEEQTAIFDLALAFGAEHIAPNAQAWDEAGEIPKDLWPKLAELGFGGLFVSDASGGIGLTRLEGTFVFEALSHSCASVAALLSIHNMCAAMVDKFGSDDLKSRILGPTIEMEKLLAYCLTEPGSGSDAAALKTRAVRTGGGYELTGTKAFISGGGYSDAYIVMCRTGDAGPKGISAIVVDDGADGLSFGGLETKMGWKSQPTRQVQLDKCVTPASNLLGQEGHGFTYAMQGLDGGRLNIAACSLGAAQAAMNQTVAYLNERKAFGQNLAQFQALQFKMGAAEIKLQAARVLLRQAAWKLDTGAPDATHHCAIAKAYVTEVGSEVVNQCLQLHGGYGYLSDYGLEKRLRDIRVHEILEGTNEIMHMIISRNLLKP